MNTNASQSGGAEAFPDDHQVFEALYDSGTFADFETSMDAALDRLVARWSHWAAPNAGLRGIARAPRPFQEGQIASQCKQSRCSRSVLGNHARAMESREGTGLSRAARPADFGGL